MDAAEIVGVAVAVLSLGLRGLGVLTKKASWWFCGAGLVLLLIGILLSIRSKAPATVTGGGDYVAGDKVGGDKVQGDKIVVQGASLEDIKNAIREVLAEDGGRLKEKYPVGHEVFAVTPTEIVPPPVKTAPQTTEVKIKWGTGRVLGFTPEKVVVLLPDMEIPGLKIGENIAAVPLFPLRTPHTIFSSNGYDVNVETLEVGKDFVVVGIGVKQS